MRIEQTKMTINEVYGKTKPNNNNKTFFLEEWVYNCWWGWQKFTFRFWKLFCFNFLSLFFFYCFLSLFWHQTKTKGRKRSRFSFCRRIGEYVSLELSHFVCLLYIQSHLLCSALWTLYDTSVENSCPPLLANGRRVTVRLDSHKRPIPVSRRTAFAIIVNSHFPFACRKFYKFRVECRTFAPTDRSYLTESVP